MSVVGNMNSFSLINTKSSVMNHLLVSSDSSLISPQHPSEPRQPRLSDFISKLKLIFINKIKW